VERVTSGALSVTAHGVTTTLPTQDVRRIEAPDRVSDGVAKGAIGAAIAGGVGTGLMAGAICEHNCGAPMWRRSGFLVPLMGAATGAVVGGLIDAAPPGRQVIFERRLLTVAPIITGRSRSVAVVIRR